MIRLANLHRLEADLRQELQAAQSSAISDGQVMLGKCTKAFEEQLAERAGAKYAAVTGSGSDALMYGLRATGVTHVTIPAMSFIATQNSCSRASIDFTYCDVDEQGIIDFDKTTNNPIVYVGLFGNTKEIPSNEIVYEDGAQHFGYPLRGVFASYSFDPTKNLPNFGNGGAVVSNDECLISNVKHLRRHGSVGYHTGGNSIMSERDCAELSVKLNHFDRWTATRRELAEYYTEQLHDYVVAVTDLEGLVSKFVIEVDDPVALQIHLHNENIQSKRMYENPLMPLPQATKNCNKFLQIPCDSYTTMQEASSVVQVIKSFFEPSPFKT